MLPWEVDEAIEPPVGWGCELDPDVEYLDFEDILSGGYTELDEATDQTMRAAMAMDE